MSSGGPSPRRSVVKPGAVVLDHPDGGHCHHLPVNIAMTRWSGIEGEPHDAPGM
jgi:hypothetical protein